MFLQKTTAEYVSTLFTYMLVLAKVNKNLSV